jgi:hypothetical protein
VAWASKHVHDALHVLSREPLLALGRGLAPSLARGNEHAGRGLTTGPRTTRRPTKDAAELVEAAAGRRRAVLLAFPLAVLLAPAGVALVVLPAILARPFRAAFLEIREKFATRADDPNDSNPIQDMAPVHTQPQSLSQDIESLVVHG